MALKVFEYASNVFGGAGLLGIETCLGTLWVKDRLVTGALDVGIRAIQVGAPFPNKFQHVEKPHAFRGSDFTVAASTRPWRVEFFNRNVPSKMLTFRFPSVGGLFPHGWSSPLLPPRTTNSHFALVGNRFPAHFA